MISFRARKISDETVKKVISKNKSEDSSASFTQANPRIKNDLKALEATNNLWGDDTFAKIIYEYAEEQSKGKFSGCDYYVLTKQKGTEYITLNPKKVLGMAQIFKLDKNTNQLNLFQVNPRDTYNSCHRKYKEVGTAILNAIKKIMPDKDILVCPAESSRDFYYLNGFVDNVKGCMRYIAKGKKI